MSQVIVTEVFALLFGLFLWLYVRERRDRRVIQAVFDAAVEDPSTLATYRRLKSIKAGDGDPFARRLVPDVADLFSVPGPRMIQVGALGDAITVVVCVDGRTKMVTFLTQQKVADLLRDEGTLGRDLTNFVRAEIAMIRERDGKELWDESNEGDEGGSS